MVTGSYRWTQGYSIVFVVKLKTLIFFQGIGNFHAFYRVPSDTQELHVVLVGKIFTV